MARLAATPSQVQQLVQKLAAFGFKPTQLTVQPDGTVSVQMLSADGEDQVDALAQWEVERARSAH